MLALRPEGTSLLAALAAVTERITLAPLVSCTNYRNPALLAKMATTVDEIAAVPGFGRVTATAIKEQLDRKPVGESINTATGEVLSS